VPVNLWAPPFAPRTPLWRWATSVDEAGLAHTALSSSGWIHTPQQRTAPAGQETPLPHHTDAVLCRYGDGSGVVFFGPAAYPGILTTPPGLTPTQEQVVAADLARLTPCPHPIAPTGYALDTGALGVYWANTLSDTFPDPLRAALSAITTGLLAPWLGPAAHTSIEGKRYAVLHLDGATITPTGGLTAPQASFDTRTPLPEHVRHWIAQIGPALLAQAQAAGRVGHLVSQRWCPPSSQEPAQMLAAGAHTQIYVGGDLDPPSAHAHLQGMHAAALLGLPPLERPSPW